MSVALGLLVGVIDVAQFMPHARRTIDKRHDVHAMSGLSVWTWTIATVQGAAWIVYGAANDLLPILLPNLVITPVCAGILALRLASGRSSAQPE
ncbi:hypothetical protein [Nocardioides sp. WS12]|uniref:hypothetical protein n=1 Tax=Nocardioides sp. WS12 TaxID=2486272 RepID=UPI0015FE5C73|nr:hypothetical protein [Nocardioides sp. WS12]